MSWKWRLMWLIMLIAAVGLMTGCWRSASYVKPPGEAGHHGDTQFLSRAQNESPLFEYLMMRWREGSFTESQPKSVRQLQQAVDLPLIHAAAEHPRVTWLGHATALVQYQGVAVLTDPHLFDVAAPVSFAGPERLVPPPLTVEQLPAIDLVVISHNHYDHLDHDTVLALGNQVTWLVPWGLKQWMLRRDIDPERVVEMDWWQSHVFNTNTKVTATPTKHWSKRTPFDTNKTLWNSWHVNINGFTFWFAGDTGYEAEYFQTIGEHFGPHDLALIPIGAYGPEYFMLPQHVNPPQAVQVHKDVRSRLSIGVHWGTFLLTHEPYLEPKQWLEGVMAQQTDVHPFITLKIGQTLVLSDDSTPYPQQAIDNISGD